MRNLIKNESIKLRRQTGYKVLTIIILVIALLIPVGHFAINLLVDWVSVTYTLEDQYDNYRELAEEYAGEDDPDSVVMAATYNAYAEAAKFFLDHELEDSWKYSEFDGELSQTYRLQAIYRLLVEKTITYAELCKTGYEGMVDEDLIEDRFGVEEKPLLGAGEQAELEDEETEERVIDYETVDWNAEYNRKTTELKELQSYILSCTSKIMLESEVKSAEAYLAAAKKAEEDWKVKRDAARSAAETGEEKAVAAYELAQYEYELAQATVRAYEDYLWGWQFLYDNDCAPDSWQYTTVTMVLLTEANTYYQSLVVMPESVWAERYDNGFQTYEEYLEDCENSTVKVSAKDALMVARYALEHDIAPSQMLESSSKSIYRTYLSAILGLLSILLIVMMGMVVANEFSSGTIRLLVIRPRRRHKILTSKILAVLMYVLALCLISGTVMLLLTVVLFGFGDLFTADLYVLGERVVAIPGMLTTLAYGALILLGMLLKASIALFFSAVTKKAALAIVIPMILNSYTMVFQMMGLMIAEFLPFLKFTILPYLSPEILLTSPLDSMSLTSISGMMYGSFYGLITSMSAIYGIFLVALHIFAVVAGTYLIFNRQQIKN